MDTITRRRFLTASGVVAGGALAAGATAYGLGDILGFRRDRPPGRKTLVLVTLYGGNDGLNTVIPYGDEAYAAARPGLTYQPDQVLRLDDTFGLNPGLKGLHALYGEKRLAPAAASATQAGPQPLTVDGIWADRAADRPFTPAGGRWRTPRDGTRAWRPSNRSARLLAGATSAVPVPARGEAPEERAARYCRRGRPGVGEPPASRAAGCFADLLRVQDLMADVAAAETDDDQDDAPATATGGAAPPMDTQLALVAKCVEAGAATRVYSVSLGGFDLHADEKNVQESLLAKLDHHSRRSRAVATNVVVAVYSESAAG